MDLVDNIFNITMLCAGIAIIAMGLVNSRFSMMGKRYKELLCETDYIKFNRIQNMITGVALLFSAVYSFIVQNNSIYDILFYLFPLSILVNEIKLNNSLK